jgi:hypothetical protein
VGCGELGQNVNQVLLVGCAELGQNVNQVLLVGSSELGQNVRCAMWVVIKHFDKFPSLFAQQLRGVNILPPERPESYIYS